MPRFLSLVALVVVGASVRAEPPSVADLVKQLGDPKFAVREAAQKELLKRGEEIVPELDRLVKGADAETADRIAKVRYNLVGYKDDIRRRILDIKSKRGLFDPIPGELNLPNELRYLIADHQPGAGDLLLDLAADEKGQLWYETRHLLVQAWDVMTADQLDRCIRQTVRLWTTHRPKFPAKVPAMISFEARLRDPGTDWPHPVPKGFTFRARTTRYLDGKPYDKPYERNDPVATVGWYRVGELAEGKHTIHAVMEYEFTQNGQKRKGEIRSKDSTFEVVSADAPDDLIAPKSAELTNRVKKALRIRDPRSIDLQYDGVVPEQMMENPEPPQVRWQARPGPWTYLHLPVWELRSEVDVDLCFEVEIRDLKTGKTFACSPLYVRRGVKTAGNIVPLDARGLAQALSPAAKAKVLLKPSRRLALTNPEVKAYFPDPIESGELNVKIRESPTNVPTRGNDF